MVLNLTSMPIAAKASAINSELLSDRPPMSSSEPIAMVSAIDVCADEGDEVLGIAQSISAKSIAKRISPPVEGNTVMIVFAFGSKSPYRNVAMTFARNMGDWGQAELRLT